MHVCIVFSVQKLCCMYRYSTWPTHICLSCVYYNFRFVNTYSRILYIFLFLLIIPIKAVSPLFETHIRQVYKLLFLAKFSLKCRICLLKLVTSVDVDVGECTDAIQHKDRGFWSYYYLVFFLSFCLHQQHVNDLWAEGCFTGTVQVSSSSPLSCTWNLIICFVCLLHLSVIWQKP